MWALKLVTDLWYTHCGQTLQQLTCCNKMLQCQSKTFRGSHDALCTAAACTALIRGAALRGDLRDALMSSGLLHRRTWRLKRGGLHKQASQQVPSPAAAAGVKAAGLAGSLISPATEIQGAR